VFRARRAENVTHRKGPLRYLVGFPIATMHAPLTGAHVIVLADASRIVRAHLEGNGWAVHQCWSIETTRDLLSDTEWDLLLLSRDMPDGDSIALCAEIRARWPHRYVMILSDSAAEDRKIEGFFSGADDCVTYPFGIEELLARVRSGLRIVDLQKALLTTNRQLEQLSLTDHLTRLRNRRAFDRELASRFAVAHRYGRALSLAIIDIDHFKSINDSMGHDAGDAVLRATAQILEQSTRQSDFLARIGGEEFGVILPEASLADATQFGEKIRSTVANAVIRTGDQARTLTVSVGIATLPHSLFDTAAELLFAADQALYRAKRNGRNRAESEKRRERDRFARFISPVPGSDFRLSVTDSRRSH
jgi:diguanylate cyclase (GGDEF)-like protein